MMPSKQNLLLGALVFGFFALALVVICQGNDFRRLGHRGLVQRTMQYNMELCAPDPRGSIKGDRVLYTDPGGRFSFVHPKDVYVDAKTTTSTQGTVTGVTLSSRPIASEGPVPDMHITVTDTYGQSVEFRTWENFDIPYYDELVSSFAFTPKQPVR